MPAQTPPGGRRRAPAPAAKPAKTSRWKPGELPRLPWMDAFIAALQDRPNVTRAAAEAGISRTAAHASRGRHPRFSAEWDAALAAPAPVPAAPTPAPTEAIDLPPPGPRSSRWPQQFLAALAETSNVSVAASTAGVEKSVVYRWRRSKPDFAAKWQAAILEGYEHLELEVLCYLRAENPTRKMDVAAALRLLVAHRETAIRLKALAGEEDEAAVRDSIDAFLEDMRQRRLANEAILIEAQPKADDVAR